eukprot:1621381-Rhodomonas_salina.1
MEALHAYGAVSGGPSERSRSATLSAYALAMRYPVLTWRMPLVCCYATCGTEMSYAATLFYSTGIVYAATRGMFRTDAGIVVQKAVEKREAQYQAE